MITSFLTPGNFGLRSTTKVISKTEYEQFKKEFVFEKLKGKQLGQSFCEKFEIDNSLLSIMKNDEETDYLIQTLGFVK